MQVAQQQEQYQLYEQQQQAHELSLLQQLQRAYPGADQETLLQVLRSCEGSIE